MSWAWIEIERRFADPAYCPRWRAGADGPPWAAVGADQKRRFGEWVSRKLDQLDRITAAVRRAEIEPHVPEIAAAGAKGLAAGIPALNEKLAAMRTMMPNATINDIVKKERLKEIRKASGWEGGAGRPASGADETTPNALAALDMWRIRKVIFPRFWPEQAKGGWRRDKLDVAKIAAARHPGATPEAAESWYLNEKLASR